MIVDPGVVSITPGNVRSADSSAKSQRPHNSIVEVDVLDRSNSFDKELGVASDASRKMVEADQIAIEKEDDRFRFAVRNAASVASISCDVVPPLVSNLMMAATFSRWGFADGDAWDEMPAKSRSGPNQSVEGLSHVAHSDSLVVPFKSRESLVGLDKVYSDEGDASCLHAAALAAVTGFANETSLLSGNLTIATQIAASVRSTADGAETQSVDVVSPYSPKQREAASIQVFTLSLQPEHLGGVDVRIRMRGNMIDLRVMAEREATAALLRADQQSVVEALLTVGHRVDVLSIGAARTDPAPTFQTGCQDHSQEEDRQSGRRGQERTADGWTDRERELRVESANQPPLFLAGWRGGRRGVLA